MDVHVGLIFHQHVWALGLGRTRSFRSVSMGVKNKIKFSNIMSAVRLWHRHLEQGVFK